MTAKYSFVIPFLNEAATIRSLVEQLRGLFFGINGECELFLVDDGRTFRTLNILGGYSLECLAMR